VEPLPCQPDFDFLPKKAFDVPATVKNEYVCYGFEVDSKEKKHLTGFAPSINNTKVVHHVLLFQSSVPVDTFHHSCSAVVPSTAKLISGWAPGAGNLVMPSEAGYPIPTGKSYWFLQIHYNNGLALSAQSDSSGFRACSTTALRKFDADTVAFGSTLFFIPPRATKTLSCEAAVEGSWTSDGPDTLHLIAAWPHMHKLGTAFEMTRVPANGQPGSAIVNVPKYSFEDQIIYPVTVDLARGDKVRTRCTWKNDGDAIVRVGERTEDEMCFGFLTYYPRAPYPRWDSPSKSSQQGGPAVCQ
jgi:hypothetical protein